MLRVKEFMTPNPHTVNPDTKVMAAVERMRHGGFRHLPVVEGEELVGVVTDGDIREAMPSAATTLDAWETSFLLHRLVVREVMSSPAFAIDENAPLEAAARTMLTRRVACLPVIAGGGVVTGVITATDLLRAFVERDGGSRDDVAPGGVSAS